MNEHGLCGICGAPMEMVVCKKCGGDGKAKRCNLICECICCQEYDDGATLCPRCEGEKEYTRCSRSPHSKAQFAAWRAMWKASVP